MKKINAESRARHVVIPIPIVYFFFAGRRAGKLFFNKNKQNSNMIMASFIIPRRVHNTMPGRDNSLLIRLKRKNKQLKIMKEFEYNSRCVCINVVYS